MDPYLPTKTPTHHITSHRLVALKRLRASLATNAEKCQALEKHLQQDFRKLQEQLVREQAAHRATLMKLSVSANNLLCLLQHLGIILCIRSVGNALQWRQLLHMVALNRAKLPHPLLQLHESRISYTIIELPFFRDVARDMLRRCSNESTQPTAKHDDTIEGS